MLELFPLWFWIALGIATCFGVYAIGYNLFCLLQYSRLRAMGAASPMSLAAWALGFVGIFLGPCAFFTSIAAIVMALNQRSKAKKMEVPPVSMFPAQVAIMNSVIAVLIAIISLILAIGSMFFMEA